MRDTLLDLIIGLLGTLDKFKGSDGTNRVFDWPTTTPGGYPYVVVGSASLESSVLDNARDTRRYGFLLQIVGEKFGEQGGKTQKDALAAARAVEDAVIQLLDNNAALGRQDLVLRVMPTGDQWATADGGSRIVINMQVTVDTLAQINYQ